MREPQMPEANGTESICVELRAPIQRVWSGWVLCGLPLGFYIFRARRHFGVTMRPKSDLRIITAPDLLNGPFAHRHLAPA